MSDSIRSRCPVVADGEMDLWQPVTVAGKQKMEGFRRRILWLRESKTQLVLRHDGVDVDDLTEFNDFYGFLTSLESAVTEDIPKIAKRLHIASSDKLAVEADVIIRDLPVLLDKCREARQERKDHPEYAERYIGVPGGPWWERWFTSDQREDPQDKHSTYPALEAKTIIAARGIYSTKASEIGTVPAALAEWIKTQRVEAANLQWDAEEKK